MVRLNGNQMRAKLNRSIQVYCRKDKQEEKKEEPKKNGKVS